MMIEVTRQIHGWYQKNIDTRGVLVLEQCWYQKIADARGMLVSKNAETRGMLVPEQCRHQRNSGTREMEEKCHAQLGLKKVYPPRKGGVSNGSAMDQQWEPEWD
jgi:hypothetical protein